MYAGIFRSSSNVTLSISTLVETLFRVFFLRFSGYFLLCHVLCITRKAPSTYCVSITEQYTPYYLKLRDPRDFKNISIKQHPYSGIGNILSQLFAMKSYTRSYENEVISSRGRLQFKHITTCRIMIQRCNGEKSLHLLHISEKSMGD